MSWLLSLLVSLLTGVLGLLVGGFVASLAVDWYRISSFEGGSGYFVVAMALLGFVAGAVIGLVVARVTGDAGMVRALGTSALIVVTSGLAIGGVSRLVADVPPTIGDERLLLAFELRWPASESRAPSEMPRPIHARLGATSGQQVRRWGEGALFVDDAHQVDGRWVVPGAVEVFTSRGGRLLDIGMRDSSLAGFLIPLPGSPAAKEREWSEWIPRARDGDPPLPDGYRVRYRVVTTSEPARVQEVGPFTVLTSIGGFFTTANTEEQGATSRLQLRYHGAPIPSTRLPRRHGAARWWADRLPRGARQRDENGYLPARLRARRGAVGSAGRQLRDPDQRRAAHRRLHRLERVAPESCSDRMARPTQLRDPRTLSPPRRDPRHAHGDVHVVAPCPRSRCRSTGSRRSDSPPTSRSTSGTPRWGRMKRRCSA